MKRKYFMDCEGCEEELEEAIFSQDEEGLYFATSIDDYMELEDMEHFTICMVNDDGEIIVW
jgi:hypothetical protein